MNLANRSYNEKRNFIRMKVETPVCLTLNDGNTIHGTCHNLSGGGMLISTTETLPLGVNLDIAVTSNHGHNPMLKANASVTRVLSQPDSVARPCYIGLKIDRIID